MYMIDMLIMYIVVVVQYMYIIHVIMVCCVSEKTSQNVT
jgi:uncharacterized membrane protein